MDLYGKIFVVVAVLAVILIGIYLYLFALDRRVRKMEDMMKDKGKKMTS